MQKSTPLPIWDRQNVSEMATLIAWRFLITRFVYLISVVKSKSNWFHLDVKQSYYAIKIIWACLLPLLGITFGKTMTIKCLDAWKIHEICYFPHIIFYDNSVSWILFWALGWTCIELFKIMIEYKHIHFTKSIYWWLIIFCLWLAVPDENHL